MKRLLLVLALVCLAAGAFATDLGIGASASYYSWDLKASAGGLDYTSTVTRVPFNFMAYVDVTYLQLAVGYRMFHGAHEKDVNPILGVVTK